MAQRSLPQAGDGVGPDTGPYTSDEWAEFFQAVFTGDQEAVQGPLIRFLNELEVIKAGLTITTLNGAGFVYGHFLFVDPAIGINVALAAADQERYDRVVMVQNNTNAAYNTNLALPAAYAAGVPRNSARIAILQGGEAGAAVLPDLLVGPNYYMVELARCLVDDAAVGDIDDRREFCEFSHRTPHTTHSFFVPAVTGWDETALVVLETPNPIVTSCYGGLEMPDTHSSYATGIFIVPQDYVSDLSVKVVVATERTGNVYCRFICSYAACGENCALHDDLLDYAAIGVTIQYNNCIRELALTNENIGDIVRCHFTRNAIHALDTITGSIVILGYIVTYTRNH